MTHLKLKKLHSTKGNKQDKGKFNEHEFISTPRKRFGFCVKLISSPKPVMI